MNNDGNRPLPKVGIGVIIEKNGKVLLGKRKSVHGDGHYALPGGHLELGESWEECARREVLEETGLSLDSVEFFEVTNDIFGNDKHYITIFMKTTTSGDPKNLEPHKCESWNWYEWDNLPEPAFLPLKNLHEKKKTL